MPFHFRYFFIFLVQTNLIMNQILNTKLKKKKRKSWFHFQFTFSIVILAFLFVGSSFYFYHLIQKEKVSNRLIANYNIYRHYHIPKEAENTEENDSLLGIPKINLYYPVFSHLTEDLLKISPCKFYGTSPKENGNLCIAGHNYDNSLFFSKLSTLEQNDEIFLLDRNNIKYVYFVEKKYEVSPSDLSPILNYDPNVKLLTLITCNNLNSNRIILQAKQKKLSK